MEENKKDQTSIDNFEPNVVAAFTYIIPPITGIIFFLLEKKSKFVRFHALQSVLFGALAYVINMLVGNLRVFYIGYFLQPIVTLLGFGLWLLLIWKAYQYEEFQIPYVGKIAADNSGFEKKAPKEASTPTAEHKDTAK